MENFISFFSSYFLLLEVLLEKLTSKQALDLTSAFESTLHSSNLRRIWFNLTLFEFLCSEKVPIFSCYTALQNNIEQSGNEHEKERRKNKDNFEFFNR